MGAEVITGGSFTGVTVMLTPKVSVREPSDAITLKLVSTVPSMGVP